MDGALEEGEERGEGTGGEEGDANEGDVGAEGGVEKVAGDEGEGALGPRGVGAVGEDGELQLRGKVPKGKCELTSGRFGFNEIILICS